MFFFLVGVEAEVWEMEVGLGEAPLLCVFGRVTTVCE